MKKIWEKNNSSSSNSLVDLYCFKESVEGDDELVFYDVLGAIAHVLMLERHRNTDKK